MNLKKFEYFNKDIPFLKRNIFFRFFFFILFLGIMSWQITSMIMKSLLEDLSIINVIVGSFVIFISILLGLISFMYVIKNIRIIKKVYLNGSCVSSVPIILNTRPNSFVNLYSIINFVLTCIALLILVSSITYSILQIAYFATISYFLPTLVLIAVSGFNSVYHLNTEMKIISTLREFHSAI